MTGISADQTSVLSAKGYGSLQIYPNQERLSFSLQRKYMQLLTCTGQTERTVPNLKAYSYNLSLKLSRSLHPPCLTQILQ